MCVCVCVCVCVCGGGLLPYKRIMGMCRWMGSHFHDWIDYNGVAFSRLSIELLEWGRTFSDCLGEEFFMTFIFTVSKRTRMFMFFMQSKIWVN